MTLEFQNPKGGVAKRLLPIIIIIAVVVGILYLPAKKLILSSAPTGVKALDKDVGTNVVKNVKVELPKGRPVTINQDKIMHIGQMQWNAQLALDLANGGARTLTDSKIGKLGAQVLIVNENDTDVMKDQLVASTTEWAKNGGKGNPTKGFQAVVFMGDGMPGYLPGWNAELDKVCTTYHLPVDQCEVRIVGSVGSSYGEDSVAVPPAWKDDPKQALERVSGKYELIAAYFWDGDHVVALDWVSQNTDENGQAMKVNPDPTTFDPDAVNFENPKDFLDAVDKYINGYCEPRKLISHGKLTTQTVTACVVGVATWTPGDWNFAHSAKDTLVKALSTKENRNQMSATLVVQNGWAKQNAHTIAAIFAGTSQAADMIKVSDAALHQAAVYATEIYGKNASLTADQWAALYKGVNHHTLNGYDIELGGSRVWDLADDYDYYGMNGGVNIYEAVYTNIGTMISQLAPTVIPKLRPLDEIFDPSYMEQAKDLLGEGGMGNADVPTYDKGAITEVFASRPYTINFDPGQATIQAGSMATIRALYGELAKSEMKVNIVGHTDNTGGPGYDNQGLSERRAEAVKTAIMSASHNSKFLPENRFSTEGRGASDPVDQDGDQNSAVERAKNRRVVITLGR